MTPTDIELMERVKGGDAVAFEELMRRYAKPLVNFFYRQCWDRDLAEDCVQEVFSRVYRHRAGYLASAKFTTFLFTIAHHLSVDRARSRGRGPGEVSLSAWGGGDDDGRRGAAIEDRIAAKGQDPAAAIEDADLLCRLRSAIESLPAGQKAVLSLGHFEGLRYEEVAAILGVPVGTVKSRMHEAIRKLRENLLAPRAPEEDGV
jgi:RNA polymerase sigma-70 factor (ECF subfamily)